jgi:hypothetical protein
MYDTLAGIAPALPGSLRALRQGMPLRSRFQVEIFLVFHAVQNFVFCVEKNAVYRVAKFIANSAHTETDILCFLLAD